VQYLWVDSAENQARFREEYEKARAARGDAKRRGAAQRAQRSARQARGSEVQAESAAAADAAARGAQVSSFVTTQRDFLNSQPQ
jgi:hypothetical protein